MSFNKVYNNQYNNIKNVNEPSNQLSIQKKRIVLYKESLHYYKNFHSFKRYITYLVGYGIKDTCVFLFELVDKTFTRLNVIVCQLYENENENGI